MTKQEPEANSPDQAPLLDEDAVAALSDIVNRAFEAPAGTTVLIPRQLQERVAAGMKAVLYQCVPESRAYAPLTMIRGGKKPPTP